LLEDLDKAGFVDRGRMGSHRNFVHPSGVILTISAHSGDDAKPYQIKLVLRKIEEAKR